jgi:hypothetical protein
MMTTDSAPAKGRMSAGLGTGSEARPTYLASRMRTSDYGPRFISCGDGRVIDDDDFIFDATITISGDFNSEQRLAFARWVAETLNAADKTLLREPRGA